MVHVITTDRGRLSEIGVVTYYLDGEQPNVGVGRFTILQQPLLRTRDVARAYSFVSRVRVLLEGVRELIRRRRVPTAHLMYRVLDVDEVSMAQARRRAFIDGITTSCMRARAGGLNAPLNGFLRVSGHDHSVVIDFRGTRRQAINITLLTITMIVSFIMINVISGVERDI